MSRDFDQLPRKRVTRPQRRHPATAFGDEPRPARQRFTTWGIIARIGAMVVAFTVLSIFFGINLVSCLLAPMVGLVLYELWYLTFETGT